MVKLTYQLAHAAAWDAANAQMRAEGRQKWNRKDFNLAARTLGRLWFDKQPEYQSTTKENHHAHYAHSQR